MAQGVWRPGMATACGSCGGSQVTYLEDGSARCASCGALTVPFWAPPKAAALAAEPAPSPPPAPVITLPPRPPVRGGFREQPQGRPATGGMASTVRGRQLIIGGVLILVGVIITVGTYSAAASNPGGGTYFIVYGPIILGIIVIVRAFLPHAPRLPTDGRRNHRPRT